jgi:hypothetical protein
MNISAEQKQAVESGQAVPLVVDGTACVLIRQDVFDRVKRIVYDDFDPEETYEAVLKAWDEEEDPGLDAYQDYKRTS